MIIQKFICDRCSNEINVEDALWMIAFEKKDRENLDDLGEYDDSMMDCHFCEKCKMEIWSFVQNEFCGLPFEAPAKEEVVQEEKPSGKRKRKDCAEDKLIAISMYKAGKQIGDIARSLDHTYQCIKNWVVQRDDNP